MVLQPPSFIFVFLTSSLLISRSTLCLVVAGGGCQSHNADHKAEEGTKQKKEEIHR